MALIIAEVQCELREVDLGNKPVEMLDASPKGTVPVLLFADGSILDESLDIMLWSFSQTNVPAWLNPEAGTLDDMLELVGRNDADFKRHLDRYKYPDRYAHEKMPDPIYHRSEACFFLNELETLLKANAFLFGPHASLADIAIFPFVRQFAATDPDWFATLESPHLQAWLTAWHESAEFTVAMHKQQNWENCGATVYLLTKQEKTSRQN